MAGLYACSGETAPAELPEVSEEQEAEPQPTAYLAYEDLGPEEQPAVDAWRAWTDAGIAGDINTGEENWDRHMDDLREQAKSADTAFKREIYTRVVQDQFSRHTLPRSHSEVSEKLTALGQGGLTGDQLERVQQVIYGEAFAGDLSNTAWLKQEFAANGDKWWTISEVGEEPAYYLWLLVQHADRDPDFQKQALASMETLLADEEVDRANYAYLYDRVAAGTGQPQRYGTQVECADGQFQPKPLEDEANLNKLRASVGLGPIEEYLQAPAFDPGSASNDLPSRRITSMVSPRRLISTGSPFEREMGYSRAVVQGGWCFVSGVTGYDYTTMSMPEDVADQARNCFRTISNVLGEAGFAMTDIARVQYTITDTAWLEPVKPVLAEWLGEIRPAATMVVAGLISPDMKIEIEVTAFRG